MFLDRLQYFLDDFWNFEKSLNRDPINGQIWTRGHRIYGFHYTKNNSNNIRMYIWTSWKICFISEHLTFWNFEISESLRHHFFVCFFGYIISICFSEDEDRQMMAICWINSRKAWMWLAYLSKNIKWIFGNS